MARRELNRKRKLPVSAADAQLWTAFLRWRRKARELLQSFKKLAAKKALLAQLGAEADKKYSGLLKEWGQRVDPDSRQPRVRCPKEPPGLFLESLSEQERLFFEKDYRLWRAGKLGIGRSGRCTQEPVSGAFRRWRTLPTEPVSAFVAEQLTIEHCHEEEREPEKKAGDLCKELGDSVAALKHSIRSIGVKKSRSNEAAAASALEAFDKAMPLVDGTRGHGFAALKRLAKCADEIMDVLWHCEYGSQLSRELAILVFERALDCGKLGEHLELGQLQATQAQQLDREGIPVPQHLACAGPTWRQALNR